MKNVIIKVFTFAQCKFEQVVDFIIFITNIRFCDKAFVESVIQHISDDMFDCRFSAARHELERIMTEVSWINFKERRKLKEIKRELMKLQWA